MVPELALSIVRARVKDLDNVLALLEEARQWLIQNGIREQWPAPHPRVVFAERIDRGEVYVAWQHDALVGTFSLLWSDSSVWDAVPDDAGYVHGMAVRRSAAFKGIGATLLNAAAHHGDPTGSLDTWTMGLATRTRRDAIPTSYVALVALTPVGSVSLVDRDMATHPELSPWLAGLFVFPSYRRYGIGKLLVQTAIRTAAGLSVPQLYLYTTTATSWYARLGYCYSSLLL